MKIYKKYSETTEKQGKILQFLVGCSLFIESSWFVEKVA